MARFTANRLQFGPVKVEAGAPDAEEPDQDDGEGLPAPKLLALKMRRAAGIAEAKGVLEHLPGPCESVHAVCTARMDLTDVIGHLLERWGRCERMAIATLGYNERNLHTLLDWLDSRRVGSLVLLTSNFFRSHKRPLFEETRKELGERKQRVAAGYSHCKVVALHMADGAKYAIEGSANLCGNGSGREQFALIRDDGLTDWHSQWIEGMVSHGQGKEIP